VQNFDGDPAEKYYHYSRNMGYEDKIILRLILWNRF